MFIAFWQPDKLQGTKQVHVGMEPSKTNQTRWEWHYYTFPPSLHLVPFCQLCTPQNSLHALSLFTPTKWTLYSALLAPQLQATFNVDQPGAHIATGCQVGACAGIVEPFKHLLCATAHPQFLVLELRVLKGTCPGQYGKPSHQLVVSLSVCLSVCCLDWRYLTNNSFHPWYQTYKPVY